MPASPLRPIGLATAASLLGFGCLSPKPAAPPLALTWPEMRPLVAKARDPRSLGLTMFEGRDGPMLEGAYRLYDSQVATTSWKKKSLLPVIETEVAALGGVSTLIDTSAPDNWMALKPALKAQTLALGPPLHTRSPDHVQQDIPGFLVLASRVRITADKDLGLAVERVPLYMLAALGSLGDLGRTPPSSARTPDLVLGADFLRRFSFVKFDFPQRRLLFSATDAFARHPVGMVASVPLREHKGAVAVEARLDGERTLLVLDTAGDFELADARDEVNLVEELEIGGLSFQDVITTPAVDVRINGSYATRMGLGLLKDYIVVLDFRNQLVHFGLPPEDD